MILYAYITHILYYFVVTSRALSELLLGTLLILYSYFTHTLLIQYSYFFVLLPTCASILYLYFTHIFLIHYSSSCITLFILILVILHTLLILILVTLLVLCPTWLRATPTLVTCFTSTKVLHVPPYPPRGGPATALLTAY